MSKVLASLCNMPQPAKSGLVLADLDTGETRLLDMGLPEPIKTCTGLALDGEWIYAVGITAEDIHYLAVLSGSDYSPRGFAKIENVLDVHSILQHDGGLYLVSTRTDCVLRYELSPDGLSNPVVVWQASSEGRDTHHINSIALWKGDVVVSAFGPKRGATWSTATEGYIHNLTQNCRVARGIYQPHSLCTTQDELYYCESAKGRIYALSGGCLEVGGYVRGLAFSPEGLFVAGTSVARKISKSTGIVNNPADPGEPSGACALDYFILYEKMPVKLGQISLAAFGSEIYDVIGLEWTEPAMHTCQVALMDGASSQFMGEQVHMEMVQELSELRYRLGVVAQERDEAGKHLLQKEAEMKALRATLEKNEAAISAQEIRLSDLAWQMEIMASELVKSRQCVDAVYASGSWKLMAPLRALARWLRGN